MTVTAPRAIEQAIRDEQTAIRQARGARLSIMDDYGHIAAAIERATEAQKTTGNLLKELWSGIKDRNTDAIDAVLKRLDHVLFETTACMASATAEVYRAESEGEIRDSSLRSENLASLYSLPAKQLKPS